MWFRRHLPILIALCGSLMLHLLSMRGASHVKVILPAGRRQPAQQEVTISLADLKAADPEKKPDKPVKPTEPEKPKKDRVKYANEMGERTGKGIGSNQSDGAQSLQAREADEDQAQLTKNPGGPGRQSTRAGNWLESPGDNGHGGHPASPGSLRQAQNKPTGEISSASDDVPIPADPVPAPAAPRVTDAGAAAPPLPAEAPTPAARVEHPADDSIDPAEPARSAPVLAVPGQKAVTPPLARPELASNTTLSPVSIGAKFSPAPPKPGDNWARGSGQAGVDDPEAVTSTGRPDSTSILRRSTTQPSKEAGHEDGAPIAMQLPVPRVAATEAPVPASAPPAPARPAFALLVSPVAPAAMTPDATPPDIQKMLPELPARQVLDNTGNSQHTPPPVAGGQRPAASSSTKVETGGALPTGYPAAHAPTALSPSAPPASPAINEAASPAIGDGRRPGAPRPGGEPGHMSDSESDAFSKIGSAQVLHDGKLEVRFGRKVKTVRPHIPIVGQVDSLTIVDPSVTLKVNIDTTGKVTDVAVFKSSGSNEIDQPTLIAMYDWWFEPLKDTRGNAIPDCVLFTINFR